MKHKSTSSHDLNVGTQSDPLTFWQSFHQNFWRDQFHQDRK